MTTTQRNAITSPVAGLTIYNTTTNCLNFYNGTAWNEDCGTPPTFLSTSGKVWMDRNLGATRVATSVDDYLAYGDLYQWGRNADGHEKIIWTNSTTGTPVNGTTDIRANGDQADDARFITSPTSNFDWRISLNNNLWQGVSGINNPCPAGFRLPTITEWNTEKTAYTINGSTAAFASPFKFTVPGKRVRGTGINTTAGLEGHYWTSTINATIFATSFDFFASVGSGAGGEDRAVGLSVRCIKG
jgi:uncharacterized protein (TIGR02145 family)